VSARVAIGALVGITGGPATYARELVRTLARQARHEYVVLTDRPEAFADIGVETVHVPLRRALDQIAWDHVSLPGRVRRARVALYHGTKGVLPWRLPVPGIVTVHDLAVYACPETFAWPQRWHFRSTVPWSVRRAARVVADSAHGAADLVARFGCDRARVRVVPLGVAPSFATPVGADAIEHLRRAHGLGEAVVACVGTIQPRKHVERVIEGFVRAGGAPAGWELAIGGRLRSGYRPAWLGQSTPGLRYLGALDDEALRALYQHAAIFVSASEYEGFGLTIAEAMAGGCAVVAVGVTSIPEVVGDAGLLVPEPTVDALAGAMARLFADEALRRDLGARACERAAGFRWEDTARRTAALYDEVLA
jgi:glycosyltransferase involved in cell wall biosynthesis